MLDSNWDLVDGPDAHEIELLNYDSQVNVIEGLVRAYIHRNARLGEGMCPPEAVLQEFHRIGTLFLLNEPGKYRTTPVYVVNKQGIVIYTPPPADEVPGHMRDFFQELVTKWNTFTPPMAAAFCLWRVNWVHPFKNGNGRSARAMAYAALCLRAHAVLPGTPTVIDLIMADRDPYEATLRHADQTFASTGVADLGPMATYIEGLLRQQLAPIVAAALAATPGQAPPP